MSNSRKSTEINHIKQLISFLRPNMRLPAKKAVNPSITIRALPIWDEVFPTCIQDSFIDKQSEQQTLHIIMIGMEISINKNHLYLYLYCFASTSTSLPLSPCTLSNARFKS